MSIRPGGLNYIEDLCGVDFSGAVIDDLERKGTAAEELQRQAVEPSSGGGVTGQAQ